MMLNDEIKEEFREDSLSDDSQQEFIDKILETSPGNRESNPDAFLQKSSENKQEIISELKSEATNFLLK
jgi:hypothetical protein